MAGQTKGKFLTQTYYLRCTVLFFKNKSLYFLSLSSDRAIESKASFFSVLCCKAQWSNTVKFLYISMPVLYIYTYTYIYVGGLDT